MLVIAEPSKTYCPTLSQFLLFCLDRLMKFCSNDLQVSIETAILLNGVIQKIGMQIIQSMK